MSQDTVEERSGRDDTSDSLHAEIRRFFYDEAATLDDRRFDEWLDMLTEDVHYRVPARESTAGGDEFIDMDHINANRFRLEKRVERLDTEHAWAEQPASRTRHFITNIRILNHDPDEGRVKTTSNLLLHINRGDSPESVRLSGERHDELKRVDGEWKVDERVVYLDHATLPIDKISVFI